MSCALAGVFATVWSTLNMSVLHIGAMLLPLGGVYAAKAGGSPTELTHRARLVTACITGLLAAVATFATYVILLVVWRIDHVPEAAIGGGPPGPAFPMLWTVAALAGGAWVTYRMLGDRPDGAPTSRSDR